jgi:hypothetical protein
MMRSALALAAFVLFAFNAATMGDGSLGLEGDPPNQTVIGDPGVMGIYSLIRIAFIGLAMLSLAAVEWGALARRIKGRLDGVDVQPR